MRVHKYKLLAHDDLIFKILENRDICTAEITPCA